MKPIKPLTQLGRTPEQGRIRLGVKDKGKGFPKSLDTFRFTSPDKEAIEEIAKNYGGLVNAWKPPRSKQNQWEVITEVSEIRIFLPPHSIDVWYEAWTAGGCERRCDGVNVEIQVSTPDGMDLDSVPCLCSNEDSMLCSPVTRLRVVLPEIKFGGVWRLESNGWNAANEIPGMAGMLSELQAIGLAECTLSLEKRSKVNAGKTKHFVVPRLAMKNSADELLGGEGMASALEDPSHPTPVLELVESDSVVDAEVIEDESQEGWDIPPEGVAVKRNPSKDPTAFRWIPADG